VARVDPDAAGLSHQQARTPRSGARRSFGRVVWESGA